MSIYTFIGGALDIGTVLGNDKKMEGIFNSSYSWILGDNVNFVVGGGRIVNIYGADVRLVCDWEELVQQVLGNYLKDSFTTTSIGKDKKSTNSNNGLNYLMGIGGSADIVFGNRSLFTYYGESLVVKRMPHDEITIVPPKPLKIITEVGVKKLTPLEKKVNAYNEKIIKTMLENGVDAGICVTVPSPIKECLYLGMIGLLTCALVLRFWNSKDGLYNSSQVYASGASEKNEKIDEWELFGLTVLITLLESTWLYLLKIKEVYTQVIPAVVTTTVKDTEKLIAEDEAKIKTWENQNSVCTIIVNDMDKPESVREAQLEIIENNYILINGLKTSMQLRVLSKKDHINNILAPPYTSVGFAAKPVV